MKSVREDSGIEPPTVSSKFARFTRMQAGTPARRKISESAGFTPLRKFFYRIFLGSRCETALALVIGVNFFLVVVEANMGAVCAVDKSESCIPYWISICNYTFLGIYTVEATARIYTFRTLYFTSFWDMFDFVIVIIGYVDLVIAEAMDNAATVPGMQMLRIFRAARLMRATRILRNFPELNAMVRGFLSAMSAMVWGFVMIIVLLVVWSVLAVELLYPVALSLPNYDEKCLDSLGSVHSTMLMFFQTLVAGDSWGACAVGLIFASPVTAMIIFAGSLLTIQLGFTNLILAVIVERAAESKEQDKQQQAKEQKKAKVEAETHLRSMCKKIDTDEDGCISWCELQQAYDDNKDLRACLVTLDIDKDDLECLFHLMDIDESGDLTYDELINCIHKSDNNDLKRQVMMIKLQVEDVWLRIRDHVQLALESLNAKMNAGFGLEDRQLERNKLRGAVLHHSASRISQSSNFPVADVARGYSFQYSAGTPPITSRSGTANSDRFMSNPPRVAGVGTSNSERFISNPPRAERTNMNQMVTDGQLMDKGLVSVKEELRASVSNVEIALGFEFNRFRQRVDEEMRVLQKSVNASAQELCQRTIANTAFQPSSVSKSDEETSQVFQQKMLLHNTGPQPDCHLKLDDQLPRTNAGNWDDAQSLWGVRQVDVVFAVPPDPST